MAEQDDVARLVLELRASVLAARMALETCQATLRETRAQRAEANRVIEQARLEHDALIEGRKPERK